MKSLIYIGMDAKPSNSITPIENKATIKTLTMLGLYQASPFYFA